MALPIPVLGTGEEMKEKLWKNMFVYLGFLMRSIPHWGFDGKLSIVGKVATTKMENRRLLIPIGSPGSQDTNRKSESLLEDEECVFVSSFESGLKFGSLYGFVQF